MVSRGWLKLSFDIDNRGQSSESNEISDVCSFVRHSFLPFIQTFDFAGGWPWSVIDNHEIAVEHYKSPNLIYVFFVFRSQNHPPETRRRQNENEPIDLGMLAK